MHYTAQQRLVPSFTSPSHPTLLHLYDSTFDRFSELFRVFVQLADSDSFINEEKMNPQERRDGQHPLQTGLRHATMIHLQPTGVCFQLWRTIG